MSRTAVHYQITQSVINVFYIFLEERVKDCFISRLSVDDTQDYSESSV